MGSIPISHPTKIESEMVRFLFWVSDFVGSSQVVIFDTPTES